MRPRTRMFPWRLKRSHGGNQEAFGDEEATGIGEEPGRERGRNPGWLLGLGQLGEYSSTSH